MKRYSPKEIEPKWQKIWQETNVYTADLKSDKPKYFGFSMFNYPSGAGIHIGHALTYTISDVKARFKRQQGFESYHPVGWDAFGLPAENYAIKAGVSPQESMATIIPSYHKQYQAMGWSNDWEKEISTHLPEYYKWTQWIFVKMHEAGLAYQDAREQWFCELCQTVLSDAQVIDGKCWRHDGADDPIVGKKEVKQWFFKITEYADEMLEATKDLDWTDSVKLAQENWIGRSDGAEIDFEVDGHDEKVRVFTTRADTQYGVTFMVLAPEHELVEKIVTDDHRDEVEKYAKAAIKKTEVERQANKEKTGVFTGAYAINPINDEKLPIWVADYVLAGYGTGAIMAVPAHDERDYEFAQKYDLNIRQVVAPEFGTKRDNETFADGGAGIVFDPAAQKYAFARLGNGTTCMFAGGLDDGESREEAIVREVIEESGLANHKYVEYLGDVYGHYRNSLKKTNRFARAGYALVILEDAALIETKLEAHEDHKLIWLDAKEALDIWEKFDGTDYDHYMYALKHAVARNIELGHDTTSEAKYFGHEVALKEGIIIGSGDFDGLSVQQAKVDIVEALAKKKQAEKQTNYKIRDWSVGRQRYWGAPIPVVHCDDCGPIVLSEDDLPVILPELTDFAPSGDGRSALARADDWLKTECPKCGGEAERETDTLDTYVCSSWYMMRYLDPHNQQEIWDPEITKNWWNVDFYNGADHATAHLLYARFLTRFFHKQGLLPDPEPFKQMLFNGKITAQDGTMFSKSKGNGVDPLEIIDQGYGADALRTYLMFAAPLDQWVRWDPQGVPGSYRFLGRIWNLVQEFTEADVKKSDAGVEELMRSTHKTIKKVSSDIESSKYNTAIAAMMACTNDFYKIKEASGFGASDAWQDALESIVQLVAPFAPHMADELWAQLGHSDSIQRDHWPVLDESKLVTDTMTIVVQVNGKLRANLEVAQDASEESIVELAKNDNNVGKFLNGTEPKKVIYVPGRLVNLVA